MSRRPDMLPTVDLHRAYAKEVRRAERMVGDADRRRDTLMDVRKELGAGIAAENNEFSSYLTPHEDRERRNMVGKLIKQAFLLGSKWEILNLVLKKGRFTYQRGKRYSELGSTSKKKVKEILVHVASQLVGEQDVELLFSDIANGPTGVSGSKQFRLNTEQIQWIKEVFAEEDAEHAYMVKETASIRQKRQKFWIAAKTKAQEESPEIHAFFEAFNGVHQGSWPTLGLKSLQGRMEDIALRESEKEQEAKKRKREHCTRMSKLAAVKRTQRKLDRLAAEGKTPKAAASSSSAAAVQL